MTASSARHYEYFMIHLEHMHDNGTLHFQDVHKGGLKATPRPTAPPLYDPPWVNPVRVTGD